MVRLGKNGTDVTSAAIRLSRFITKKNKIAVWLPWMARLVYFKYNYEWWYSQICL